MSGTHDYLAELSMDGQALLLPQPEVRLLESVLDLESDAAGGYWLMGLHGRVPVWSLDRRLAVLESPPPGRRFCALLGEDEIRFGLTVSGFRLIRAGECRLSPLPVALRGPDPVLTGVAVLGERILPLSDCAHLARRLPWPAEAVS